MSIVNSTQEYEQIPRHFSLAAVARALTQASRRPMRLVGARPRR
jgi:hypothetical protein